MPDNLARGSRGRKRCRTLQQAPTLNPEEIVEVAREFPRVVFFAGKMIFQRERWYHRLLHNETALAVEKRLRWVGQTMVTLPIRVREAS